MRSGSVYRYELGKRRAERNRAGRCSGRRQPLSDSRPMGGVQSRLSRRGSGMAIVQFARRASAIYVSEGGAQQARVVGFYESRVFRRYTFDRTAQLPFKTGSERSRALAKPAIVETGASVSDDAQIGKHEVGFGLSWMNDAYALAQKSQPVGSPIAHGRPCSFEKRIIRSQNSLLMPMRG